MRIVDEYLRNLASELPSVNEKLIECVRYWEPETPPITVIFGEVGRAIAEHLHEITEKDKEKLFAQIEGGITSSDPELATAVATGLIESLVTKTDDHPALWEQLEGSLGPFSLRHALSWRNLASEAQRGGCLTACCPKRHPPRADCLLIYKRLDRQ